MSASTIHARPISFAEIQALAQPDAPEVTAYLPERSKAHGITFTPVTIKARLRTRRDLIHVPIENPRYDPESSKPRYIAGTDVLGEVINVDWKSVFGVESGLRFATTEEAEKAAAYFHFTVGDLDSRESLYIEDSNGQEVPLTPVYGTQANVGIIVKGLSTEETQERIERALRAEFGDALPKVHKMLTRPVKDVRINVTQRDYRNDIRILATNILEAEAQYVGANGYYTEEVDPAQVVGS